MKLYPSGPLWPDWREEKANEFIANVPKIRHWPAHLRWDGMHCHRHGAAQRAKREVLEAVKKRGNWNTDASARHYSRILR